MRVGFVVGRFPILSETFVISQMAGMVERGFQVGIVCDGIARTNREQRRKEPLASLMPHARDWWGKIGGLRPQIERLPHALKDKVSTALDMFSVRRLNDFDAVIAHFGQNGARVARLKKRCEIRPPIVTIFHGFDVGVPFRENGLDQYRDLFRLGALNLTVNHRFRDMLIECGAPCEHTAVHHMGIDVEQIPYDRCRRDDTTLQLISVCRLIEKKGIEFALRALSKLRASHGDFDWHYTIIGDGPLRKELEYLARELGLLRQVTFLGSRAHHEVKQWLSRSHAFVLPSVTARNGDVEGIPVALMEAMASGLTVVSSYHSGIPELIEDGRTGFLAAEGDVDTLADRIAWIIENPRLCDELADAARRKIEADYNSDVLNDRLATMVTKLAGSRSHV
ncbi:glycosyltransferase (plasmid) [Rhizobium sp. CB3171]|uniref:glycosyltransferase n=1 Tax=Rhizobium sp. CB3171 TaxID=3039157 RepID=UPI0024B16BCE|nr:glycosyltransferase [Rhizobium sp. CB3171]WFU07227.1 glycosyltransferase [Rhizobium sp. CB3171]